MLGTRDPFFSLPGGVGDEFDIFLESDGWPTGHFSKFIVPNSVHLESTVLRSGAVPGRFVQQK